MQWTVFVLWNTNRMESALRQARGRDGGAALPEAASLACATLRSLLIDAEFRATVERAYRAALSDQPAIETAISELDSLKSFLEQERYLLLEAGLDRKLIDESFTLLQEGISEIGIQQLEPHELFGRLRRLKDATCRLPRHLELASEQERWYGVIRRLALASIGLGLVGLNVSALAASLGISVFGSAVSQTLGGSLFGLSAKWLEERMRLD
jgi:hypothetical protein